jgi:hypothetical protein
MIKNLIIYHDINKNMAKYLKDIMKVHHNYVIKNIIIYNG